jgi:hypothetical protein
MNSFLMPQFWVLYGALAGHVRQQARQAYALFQQDPHHPSLRFRQDHPTRPIFSARVGLHYRAVGIRGTVPKPGKFGFSSLTLGSVLPGSS